MEVCDIVQEAVIKTTPKEKKMQKGKMAVWGRLTNSCEKKRSKRKMRKEKMWELDYKESWVPKNWCFLTMVLEKTLESPLDCKEIQPVHPKGNQSWIFIGRTDAEAETLILCPPDAKNWLIGKDSDAGKDWRREEKGMTENEMVGWHHWHEFV